MPMKGHIFSLSDLNVIAKSSTDGINDAKAYRCYCTKERIDALRRQQMEAGEQVHEDELDTPRDRWTASNVPFSVKRCSNQLIRTACR